MKQFFVTIAGVFVGMFAFMLFFFVFLPLMLGMMIAASAGARQTGPAGSIVVELDLRPTMLDQAPASPFAFAQAPALLDFVRAMEAAAADDRVKGVFIRANEGGMSPAQAEEVRDALLRLREAGKFVVAHSQGFSSTSVLPYVALSAADEIWFQQTASFSAAGLTSETPFYGGTLEKYGALPQILQIAEYKNAANSYTQSDYTEPHREALTDVLDSIYTRSVDLIAQDRGLTPDEVRALFDAAPYNADGAARAGLVDRVGHVVEAREAVEARVENANFVPLADYLRMMDNPWDEGARIALIAGQGDILTGESWNQDTLLSGSDAIGSDTIAQAFQDAAEDESVKAIVFRIDSPGGSVVASEQIWDAVRRAREAGKPVVVSMGDAAASGGYYVATPADLIVAQPTTITGSIGIYGGKIVLDGTLDLIDLNIEPLSVGGEFAGAYSAQTPFTERQLVAMRRELRDGYDTFTSHVAEGRGLSPARVEEIARGRVWTGAQAHQLGLVDELGGFTTALAAARRLGGIEEGAPVTLRSYPARPTFFEQMRRLFGGSSDVAEAAAVLVRVAALPEVRALLDARADANAGAGGVARLDVPAVE